MTTFDSVLLIAFGGPEKSEDIRPFLERVTAGRRIPRARIDEVVHHYELIGGYSPFNQITFRQASALQSRLASLGRPMPVYVGMRNWHPLIEETLERMTHHGRNRALGLILSSFQTEASWDRYMDDVEKARKALKKRAPEVFFAPPWSHRRLFIQAVAKLAAGAAERAPYERQTLRLVFTAHSIPKSMADASPYVSQYAAASRAVAQRIGFERWILAYQSRSGSPQEPWLEPDIGETLDDLASAAVPAVLVVPIGFTCDHVEVLYDLDVEAKKRAQELGIDFYRAPAVNDDPDFVAMLADLVVEAG